MDSLEQLLPSANELIEQKKYQIALNLISKSSLTPDSCEALLLKSKCFLELKKFGDVEQSLTDAKSSLRKIRNSKERDEKNAKILLS